MKPAHLASAALTLVLLAGCRHPGQTGPTRETGDVPSGLTDTVWNLTHLGGSRVVSAPGDEQPHLRFVSGESRLEGYGSCNRFSAAYSITGNGVRLAGPAISTKRACLDPALNSQEQQFLSSLETLSR